MNINYSPYLEVIKQQLTLIPEDWNFKNDLNYTLILEHVSYELGNNYLNIIKKEFLKFYESNFDILKNICDLNDKYGKTNKYQMGDFMICSPTNMRYLAQTLLILEDMKKYNLNNVDIIEIGGGYGGLCFFIHSIAPLYEININSYTIFDLLEASLLQEKYLNALKIDNVQFYQIDNFKNLKNNSFLISNYAFSELSKDIRIEYTEKIINPYTKFGFLLWNFIPVYNFVENSIIEENRKYTELGGDCYVRYYPPNS